MNKYFHLLPFYPLIQFIRIQKKWGLVSSTNWYIYPIWLIKILLIEPLRLLDTIVLFLLPEKQIKPIFIIGYYRSGTTYLQELLSLGEKHATMTLFQSVLPEISLCFGRIFCWIFNPILKAFKVTNKYHHVAFDFNFPGEEDVGINALSSFVDYNRIFQYPSKYAEIGEQYLLNLSKKDKETFKVNYRLLIKKVAASNPNKTLILKSPPNMARIALLKEMYPEAKFIHIHRDPYRAIVSTKRLWHLNKAFTFEAYTSDLIDKVILDQYISFYKAFYANGGATLDFTIRFEEFIVNENKTIKDLYGVLDLKEFDKLEPELVKKIEKRKSLVRKEFTDKELLKQVLGSAEVKEIREKLGYSDR